MTTPENTTYENTATASLIIIGAGHAGSELAVQARQQGWQGRITLLGAEPHLPYHRPPLSKTYLSGKVDAHALPLRPRNVYDQANIDLRLDSTVTHIDRRQQRVALQDGSSMSYDVLALCTGGQVRPWTCEGVQGRAEHVARNGGAAMTGSAHPKHQPRNLHYLRTLADADALRARLRPDSRLAVIGGGYIGLEVAASARSLGAQVTLWEAQARLLSRAASAPLADFYATVHRDHGVAVRTTAQIVRAECNAQGDILALHGSDGARLDVDLVVAGIGMTPNVQLAQDAGLDIDVGIVVDACGRTSDPRVFAAGDCTVYDSAHYGRRIRLESVPNALEQARAAAHALCGKPHTHGVPWFWSDQYDLKLQMAGLTQGHDEVVQRGSLAQRSCITFYLRAGRVLAVEAVNRPADFMVCRKLIETGVAVQTAQLTDPDKPLRDLLQAAA